MFIIYSIQYFSSSPSLLTGWQFDRQEAKARERPILSENINCRSLDP